MRKIILILFFLILASTAGAEDYYLKDNLLIALEVENDIEIIPGENGYDVKDLKVYLSFVPLDDENQDVLSLKTEPDAKNVDGELLFEWDKIEKSPVSYRLDALIQTKNNLIKINEKPNFPVFDTSQEEFLIETDSVDYKQTEIRQLATSLASGEDDEYVVVHKIAEWVNKNIEYSLDTTTTHASKKASWVLENKRGVCDEITNLFIGLCRSVGIPARFVSGISYTTDTRFDEWSSHGWAEVYFPDYGWVPFDVTYGQFGYISPGHIKLKVADDANKSSTKYQWQAKTSTIKTGKLKTNTHVQSEGKTIAPLLNIETEIAKKETGFGSYNAVEVSLVNSNDFYVPTELSLSKTNEIEIFDEYNHYVLMPPNSKKSFFYIFKIENELSDDYFYTFKISSKTYRNATSNASFRAGAKFPVYSLDEIREFIDAKKIEEEKEYSKNITLECDSDKKGYLVGETAKVWCNVRNTGNMPIYDINACFEDDCKTKSLEIGEEKKIVFSKTIESEGEHRYAFLFENENISKREMILFEAFTRPKMNISDLAFPEKVSLDEQFNISFVVTKASKAPVKNLKIEIDGGGINQKWAMEDIDSRQFIIHVDKNVLISENNEISILLYYTDMMNRSYFSGESFVINLHDLNISQKILLSVNKLQWEIEKNPVLAIGSVILIVIITILVLKWILRPSSKF